MTTASSDPARPAAAPPLPAGEPPHHEFHSSRWSAETVLTGTQKLRYLLLLGALVLFIVWDYKIALTVLNFVLCAFYAFTVWYKARCVTASLFHKPDLAFTPAEVGALQPAELPVFTVLVPLYKEANIVGRLLTALGKLDYPADKLDIKLLVEVDDIETAAACRRIGLPAHIELLVVPDGTPRTKPRACNYGLEKARGDLLVIFDAEDRPDPDQLRKAVLAFRRVPAEVVCLQAKLNYFNARQNWLTCFFALEYTVWFELFLPGLHRIHAPIPLGGTSNHFRVEPLRRLGGWDPYNVTEDCDLGIRLARCGFRTMILDSTTWEEANSHFWNWVRQRSRWVKGYLQTHWVHTRGAGEPWRDLGVRGSLGFLFTVGGQVLTQLLNPFYWLILAAWCVWQWRLVYFDLAPHGGYTLWSKVSWVFFGLTLLLVAANLLFILINAAACIRRRWWFLLPYALLSPIYWAMISLAAWKGVLQLAWNPFYWEKTVHGLDDADAGGSPDLPGANNPAAPVVAPAVPPTQEPLACRDPAAG